MTHTTDYMWRFGLVWTLLVMMVLILATSSANPEEFTRNAPALFITGGFILMLASMAIETIQRLAEKSGWLGGVVNGE